jgi:hypothetical protein
MAGKTGMKPQYEWSVFSLICLFFAGCGEVGDAVQADRLERDQALWAKAGPADYNLEWQSISSRNQSIYRVYVRGGKVEAVRLVRPDGKQIALKPADVDFYSVPGLFRTIREELMQSKQPRPFGQPEGTTVVLTMRSDPELGYPTLYRRDIFGVDERMGIDVTSFNSTSEPIPPPDPAR